MASKIVSSLPLFPYKCGVSFLKPGDSDRRFVDTGRDVVSVDHAPRNARTERLYLADSWVCEAAGKLGMVWPDPDRDPDRLEAEIRKLRSEVDRLSDRLRVPVGFVGVEKAEQEKRGVLRRYKSQVDAANKDVDGFVPQPLPKKYLAD